MPSNDPTALPPPTPGQPRFRQMKRRPIRNLQWWIGGAIGAVFLFGAIIAGAAEDDGKKYTLAEAACKLLNEGDEPEFVYSVMKDLAADHPLEFGEHTSIAARYAVQVAQGRGCG